MLNPSETFGMQNLRLIPKLLMKISEYNTDVFNLQQIIECKVSECSENIQIIIRELWRVSKLFLKKSAMFQ